MTLPCTLPGSVDATVPGRSEYGKDVQVRERRALEIARRACVEVLVGLAGKADDDVRPDRRMRHARRGCRPRAPRTCSIVYGRRISSQDAIRRMLQRQMEVRRDQVHQARERKVHRLERADAEKRLIRGTEVPRYENLQQGLRATIAACRSRPYEPRCTPVMTISL